ncbi:polysaccharide pyruvyl transferase family protein [Gramella sp. BOM4]|nr:polysaccharide pyruvyl transferase family protein [Christiangramia bathymodioli]
MEAANCHHGTKDFIVNMIGKNKKRIHFLSASDRINYGDLLFPIIIEKLFDDCNTKIIKYGIVESNLSDFGALPTLSYREFQRNIKKDGGNVIVGGGEVLFVDWGSLYAFINFFYSKVLFRIDRFEAKFNLTRFFLSDGNVKVPFAPQKKELRSSKEIKIIYNAVGGTFKNSRLRNKWRDFKKSLIDADYISVRDKRVSNSLKEYGIESVITPDSALIISDLFPFEELLGKISFNPDQLKDYIFLQIGKPYTPPNKTEFFQQLKNLSEKLEMEIILCPIGLAPRHEDDIYLTELSQKSEIFTFIMPKNIYDIMFLIANSKIYLGTSLHGLITAQSFGVPFIPMDKRVIKVEEYCKTWTFKNINRCINYSELNEIPEIFRNWDSDIAYENLVAQKELVYKNFKNIEQHLI